MPGDLTLHFVYPEPTTTNDIRTVQMRQVVEGSADEVEMYKFHHPVTGSVSGVTTFHRMNFATARWENAGQIDWSSKFNAVIYFGVERVPIRELRKPKKSSSKSRRFKVSGTEYKWKLVDDSPDMTCVTTRGKSLATWTEAAQRLWVSEKVDSILDRIVVTCFLNIWMKSINAW
ncbi:hypothetical protein C8Q75DRAFT_269594 [Abortiporus biennis]|nr:hypothetical protein C8Q75DRAFT_269594 [Abortiporus biennis]